MDLPAGAPGAAELDRHVAARDEMRVEHGVGRGRRHGDARGACAGGGNDDRGRGRHVQDVGGAVEDGASTGEMQLLGAAAVGYTDGARSLEGDDHLLRPRPEREIARVEGTDPQSRVLPAVETVVDDDVPPVPRDRTARVEPLLLGHLASSGR
ncbi:hypothetical protein GCM10025865_14050 [Paraoerskovia sediminicola]|uniref:Uncharacterized protein n=1 Tax=Paraoerskovia sediminicola TaxID=1138587 RepID=A0ABM8G1V8_9CELL|nr:hypothetical protein GCM10025865_14050 [Paraoerskovia sediminicola]